MATDPRFIYARSAIDPRFTSARLPPIQIQILFKHRSQAFNSSAHFISLSLPLTSTLPFLTEHFSKNKAMMEVECFTLEDFDDEIFQLPQPPVPVAESSFVQYTRPSFWFPSLENEHPIKLPNVHKRMIEFLRTIPTNNTSDESPEFVNDRNYKHMLSERARRDKQKNTYTALHELLPPGTKSERNVILQKSALHLQELETVKKHFQKRNHELEKNVMSPIEGDTMETDTFRLRRQTPPSGIDSMISVLTTMKNMGLKAKSVQTEFSSTEFFAVLGIEQKIEAVMVEKAIENALKEVEWKFWCDITAAANEWCNWDGYS